MGNFSCFLVKKFIHGIRKCLSKRIRCFINLLSMVMMPIVQMNHICSFALLIVVMFYVMDSYGFLFHIKLVKLLKPNKFLERNYLITRLSSI